MLRSIVSLLVFHMTNMFMVIIITDLIFVYWSFCTNNYFFHASS